MTIEVETIHHERRGVLESLDPVEGLVVLYLNFHERFMIGRAKGATIKCKHIDIGSRNLTINTSNHSHHKQTLLLTHPPSNPHTMASPPQTDATALATLTALENRLQRLTFYLTGSSTTTELPPHFQDQLNRKERTPSPQTRLAELEAQLVQLAEKRPGIRKLLELRMLLSCAFLNTLRIILSEVYSLSYLYNDGDRKPDLTNYGVMTFRIQPP